MRAHPCPNCDCGADAESATDPPTITPPDTDTFTVSQLGPFTTFTYAYAYPYPDSVTFSSTDTDTEPDPQPA